MGIFGQKGQFWTVFGQNGQNGNFFQKSAWNIFLALTSPNFKVSEKSNERFSRNRVTHARTHARTNGRDSLGLQRLHRETKNGQNTDLNNQNVEFKGPLKSQKRPKNELTNSKN